MRKFVPLSITYNPTNSILQNPLVLNEFVTLKFRLSFKWSQATFGGRIMPLVDMKWSQMEIYEGCFILMRLD